MLLWWPTEETENARSNTTTHPYSYVSLAGYFGFLANTTISVKTKTESAGKVEINPSLRNFEVGCDILDRSMVIDPHCN